MYVFRKRSKIKNELAKHKSREVNRKLCPGCSAELSFVESTADRDTFICNKCDNVISFGKSIDKLNKKTNDKKLNLITVREKPSEKSTKGTNQTVDILAVAGYVGTVREAMDSCSVLSFLYTGSRGIDDVPRSVEPYKLTASASGEVLLYGYDLDANSIRLFKLGGMVDMQKTEYTYVPRWDIIDKLDKKNGK